MFMGTVFLRWKFWGGGWSFCRTWYCYCWEQCSGGWSSSNWGSWNTTSDGMDFYFASLVAETNVAPSIMVRDIVNNWAWKNFDEYYILYNLTCIIQYKLNITNGWTNGNIQKVSKVKRWKIKTYQRRIHDDWKGKNK